MLALLALLAFVLSPFVTAIGPWPMVTIGLAFIAAHLLLGGWAPWRKG